MHNFDVLNTFNSHPNTTIMVPGGCNASCQFCFWNQADGKVRPEGDYDGWIRLLTANLLRLPRHFRSLSISGGEPTLSPYFKFLPQVLSKVPLFERVVLTTNGVGLQRQLPIVTSICTHVNISRHHYDDRRSQEIFGTTSVPNAAEIKTLIQALGQARIGVTLNCVIAENVDDPAFIMKYLQFAHALGAEAVSFRKQASDISPTPVEKCFVELFGQGESNNCPVCRGHEQRILGMACRWKGSVQEPSLDCGKVYEAVIRPDGKVYADWAGNHPLNLPHLNDPRTRGTGPDQRPRTSMFDHPPYSFGSAGPKSNEPSTLQDQFNEMREQLAELRSDRRKPIYVQLVSPARQEQERPGCGSGGGCGRKGC